MNSNEFVPQWENKNIEEGLTEDVHKNEKQ